MPALRQKRGKTLAAALLVAGCAAFFAWRAGSAEILARAADARAFAALHPVGAALAFALAFALLAALAVPAAAVMSMAGGALFGPWIGLPLVVACSVAGATASMLLVRHALRDRMASRFPDLVRRFDDAATWGGAAALLSARLTPLLPYPLVNAAAGMSGMRASTFALVSAVGLLPITAINVAAGAALGAIGSPADVLSPRLVAVLALLAAAPLLARLWVLRREPPRLRPD